LIAYGSSITVPETYERCARRGFERVAEPDSKVFAHAAAGPLARSYNLILQEAVGYDDLEALVLVHQDVEILDSDFCTKLRRALRNPDVAVVGCVGATDVDSIAWWDGSVVWDRPVYRYGELGGGDISWTDGEAPPGEVDTVYGLVLALSPWTVRTLRFDESLAPLHGYDFDLCRQVRAAGRKVVTEDVVVAHHHSLELVAEPEAWVEAHMVAADKWDACGDDWKGRARRAEADAAAARLLAASRLLQAYAQAEEHERRLKEITDTLSWRVTRPLRRLNALRASVISARCTH
jgi:Glycosyltransferase like family